MLQRLMLDFAENEEFEKEGEGVLADYWSLAGWGGEGGSVSVAWEGKGGEIGTELPL